MKEQKKIEATSGADADAAYFDPRLNNNVISLIRQSDGNWKAYGRKYGQMIEVRQISPMACLEYWLVHDGKVL